MSKNYEMRPLATATLAALLFIASSGCAGFRRASESDIEYWERRAREHGARSVLNLGHTAAELEEITRLQADILFPILRRHLRGHEKVVLDFGSGPGRFTPGLAAVVGGRAIGVDPIQSLLDLAPRAPGVEYKRIENGRIPLADRSVDVVWISLVLGTITEQSALRQSVAEVERVLRDGGLLFLVENTAERRDKRHFEFRPVEFYASIFPSIPMIQHVGDYYDFGERISVMVGRKMGGPASADKGP
jgi:SAM-dependent methyltransferase